MATIKGKYIFKETLDIESLSSAGEFVEYFNFISGYEGNPLGHYELEHTGMYIELDTAFGDVYFGYTLPDDNRKQLVYLNGWQNERMRYVDFGDGATMSDRLSSWILANADYVLASEYVIKAEMLTEIADAIREKAGINEKIVPESMASLIRDISGYITVASVEELDNTTAADGTIAIIEG